MIETPGAKIRENFKKSNRTREGGIRRDEESAGLFSAGALHANGKKQGQAA